MRRYGTIFAEALLKKMYGYPAQWFINRYNLISKNNCLLSCYHNNMNGLHFALTDSFYCADLFDSCIVGAPCIDHCNGKIGDLTIQVIVDIITPMALSKALNLPYISIISDREEIELVEGLHASTLKAKKWIIVGNKIKDITEEIAQTLKLPWFRVFTTTDNICNQALSELLYEHTKLLSNNDLDGLYSLDGKSNFPANNQVFHRYYQYYQRNIIKYLPQLHSTLSGNKIEHLIVSENLQQLKAVLLAKNILHKRSEKINQLIHVPCPSFGENIRMSRAQRPYQVTFGDSEKTLVEKLNKSEPECLYYWQNIFPDWFTNGDKSNKGIAKAVYKMVSKISKRYL